MGGTPLHTPRFPRKGGAMKDSKGEQQMRRTLLISVAALALAAGGQVFAQGSGGGGGAGGAGGGTGGPGPGGSSGGTMQQSPSGGSSGTSGGATRESPSGGSAQTEPAPGGQKGTKQGQTEQRGGAKQGASERNGGSKQGASEREGGTRQGASEGTKQGGSAGTTAGRAGGGSNHVTLNSEQKTRIRQSVLTSSAPRVSTVNFDVRVGTVVPRSVHIVELPPTLVEIEPEWRGYRYFVYHDEIVIIDPETLRIIAVLEV